MTIWVRAHVTGRSTAGYWASSTTVQGTRKLPPPPPRRRLRRPRPRRRSSSPNQTTTRQERRRARRRSRGRLRGMASRVPRGSCACGGWPLRGVAPPPLECPASRAWHAHREFHRPACLDRGSGATGFHRPACLDRGSGALRSDPSPQGRCCCLSRCCPGSQG